VDLRKDIDKAAAEMAAGETQAKGAWAWVSTHPWTIIVSVIAAGAVVTALVL
jgi:hypothetical protein